MANEDDEMTELESNPSNVFIKLTRSWTSRAYFFLEMTLIAFIAMLALFLVCYYIPITPVSLALRAVSGFIAVIVIPGVVASSILLPQKSLNLGTSLMIGLFTQIIGIQTLYTVALVSGLSVPLPLWILALDMSIMLLGVSYIRFRNLSEAIKKAIYFDRSRRFVGIIVLAITIRLAMQFVSEGCLAPDASLYADFARNLLEGDFSSSVLNDSSVIQISESVDYLSHHAFTYVFAISWLLIPPTTSGPVFVLAFIGVLLIFPIFEVAKGIFGKQAATIIAGSIALHPLFVYHSAVGYGPEITSLLFLAYAVLLIFQDSGGERKLLLLSGLLLGIVDAIWFPNFYIVCITLPVASIILLRVQGVKRLFTVLLLPLAIIARVYYLNVFVFYGLWIMIFIIGTMFWKRLGHLQIHRGLYLLAGIGIVMAAMRWPRQMIAHSSGLAESSLQSNPLVSAIISPTLMATAPGFSFFFIYHITPIILLLAVISISNKRMRYISISFISAGIIASVGTLMALSTISGSLQIIYLYSDSRFFLFIALVFVLSMGGFFMKLGSAESADDTPHLRNRIAGRGQKRVSFIVCLIVIGFIPGYLATPSGFSLIDMEERYGWKNLPEVLSSVGTQESIFLADRVREFAWLTNRLAAYLSLSERDLNYIDASAEILSLTSSYSTDYLIVDGHTVAKWGTLDFLLLDPVSIGAAAILNLSQVAEIRFLNNTGMRDSLTLVAETDRNEHGRIARVYSIDSTSFTRFHEIDFNDLGWNATSFGHITNSSGSTSLVIGNNQNSTCTWRYQNFDLNLDLATGFILFDFEEVGAEVDRIEIWDETGNLFRYADHYEGGLYLCFVGEVSVGDIRICITGNEGNSVVIHAASYWCAS